MPSKHKTSFEGEGFVGSLLWRRSLEFIVVDAGMTLKADERERGEADGAEEIRTALGSKSALERRKGPRRGQQNG